MTSKEIVPQQQQQMSQQNSMNLKDTINTAVYGIISNNIVKIINNKNMSIVNVGALFFVYSIYESNAFKTVKFNNLQIYEFYSYIIDSCKSFVFYLNPFRKQVIIPQNNAKYISFDLNKNNLLIECILKHPNVSYSESNKLITPINKQDFYMVKNYKNVNIKYKEFTIFIKNINVKYFIQNNNYILIKDISNNYNLKLMTDIENIFISNKISIDIKKIESYYKKLYEIYNNPSNSLNEQLTENLDKLMVLQKIKSIGKYINTEDEILLILFAFCEYGMKFMINEGDLYIRHNKNKLLFQSSVNIPSLKPYKKILTESNVINDNLSDYLYIKIEKEDNEIISNEDLNDIETHLIGLITNYKHSYESDNINLYHVKMNKKQEKITKDNIDYKIYEEMLNKLNNYKDRYDESMKEKDSKENTSPGQLKRMIEQLEQELNNKFLIVPEKQIEEMVESSEIVSDLINNSSKLFSSLYLQKNNQEIIKNILDKFLYKKELYKQYGLKNKLGFLLSGLPGCGKSSTILAIATYLKRDIYYISLNGITTNRELKDIFDYVNKTKQNKSMIVFEDIDAQTNIVYDRGNKNFIDNFKDNYDDKLDLSFFLNILDGILTLDDSVLIMTTNHKDKLDPALYRCGRMNNIIEYNKCDHHQFQAIFKDFRERELPTELLNKLPEYKYTPAQFIYYLFNHDTIIDDNEIIEGFLENTEIEIFNQYEQIEC